MKDFTVPEGKLVTMLVDGTETAFIPGSEKAAYYFTDKFAEIPCSYKDRGNDDYRAAICVGPDGILDNMSVTAAVRGGTLGADTAQGITINSTSHDFSALILNQGCYTLKDASLNFITDSDGSHVSDFTGYGSIVSAFNHSRVTLENCDIESIGVAKPAIFCDEGSDGLMLNCRARVMGGTTYPGYPNTADCTIMVAPPWVLGIAGTARGTNEMGTKPSLTLVDCDMNANQWGVLSTDGGDSMLLVVVDSTLTLHGDNVRDTDKKNPYISRYGSGYGTYIIGNATEEFYGVDFRVGTYASICRGGTATYRASAGQITSVSPTTGEVIWAGEGKGRITTVESDGFGIMAHGTGTLNVIEGTVFNTRYATFLMKAGGITINADNAVLNPADGVLLQVMDDDDSTVGVDWSREYMLYFHTEFHEKAGWPSENGQITSQMPPAPAPEGGMPMPEGVDPEDFDFGAPQYDVRFNAAHITLRGDLFNGSGYYGQQAKQMYVTLGEGAVLEGAVSATETIHVNEKGEQNTHFTIDEYYYLGHLANRPFFNGDNTTEVVLENGAVWAVTGESRLTALTVNAGCTLNGRVTVDGAAVTPAAGMRYAGDIRVMPD